MVAGLVLRELALVVVPLLLALFPATLLVPPARWAEPRGIPRTLAAFLTLLGGLLFFFGIATGTITLVVAQLPDILDSAGEGVERLEGLVGQVVPGFEIPAADEVRPMILDRLEDPEEGEEAEDVASQALSVTMGAVGVVAGMLLTLVILFFYLKRGRAMAAGLAGFIALRSRDRIMTLADEAWETLGAYFRGQLLVAFAHGGLGIALGVAGIVLVVQQLESNVLEPLILSRVIDLNPLAIIVSIAVGAIVLGVRGPHPSWG